MGLITNDDLARMQADVLAMMGDRQEEIVIRRGDSTLGAQTVRIARTGGRGRERNSDGAQEVRADVIVVGGTGFDVQPEDRFNDENGVLYRVVLVRPNRSIAVVAEAVVVE